MLVYYCNELLPFGYMNFYFQSDRDSCKSTSRFVFTLGGGVINLRSVKQSFILLTPLWKPSMLLLLKQ